jgi:fibronectin-binding autotransporter adhesin
MRNSLRRSLRALPACALVLSGFAITGASFFVAPSVASAAPPACTDSWKAAVSGNWDTATNWSTGAVPGSGDVACITVGGTYTVTYQPASGSETVDALVVGSGTTGDAETLLIQGTCSDNVTLTTKNTAFSPDSDAINSTGHVSITSTGCGNNSTLDIGTTLVNGGTLSTDAGAGGARSINGSVTNQKTVNINTSVSYGLNGSSGTWDNAGALNLATGQTLTANTTGVTFTNDTGGSVVSTGTGQLVIDAPDVYNQGNGTTSGEPVLLNGPVGSTGIALHYTGSGASSIVAQGGDGTVDGAIASGQTLTVNGTCSNNAVETVDASESNAGAVHVSSSGCGNSSTLVVTTGDTFTNQSGATLQVDAGAGGARTITGNVTNQGMANIDAVTSFASGTWDNAGQLNVADGETLTVTTSPSSFTDDTGGSVVSNGTNQTGQLVVDGGNTYNQGNGTTSGEPVLLAGPVGSPGVTLHYTGSGASTIVAQGGADTVDGAIVAGQTLTVNGTCSNNAVTTVDANETNAGTVHLSSSGCGNSSMLAVATGKKLTNLSGGIIDIDSGAGGARTITGNLTNQGTVNDNVSATYSGGTWDNKHQLNLANGVTLDAPVSTSTTFTDDTGGSVNATGSGVLELNGGNTYNQGAGTTTGTEPVLLAGPAASSGGIALHYTGAGSSLITTNGAGTLDGTISSGQTLNVVGVCSNNADEVLDAPVTSTGTIAMTSAQCGNASTIAGASATGQDPLTIGQGGLFETLAGAGNGGRTIDDDMTVKKGTVDVNTNTTYTAEKKGIKQKGTVDIASGVTLTESGVANSSFSNAKGSITGSGELLVQSPDTFKEGKATIASTVTVLVNGANVFYSPVSTPGAGTIETEGNTTLTSGTPSSGQILDVNGTCSLNANLLTTGSITDNGEIELSSSGCGNNSAVTLPAGDTLTLGSTGSLTWPSGAGGARTVTGNVVNDGTMGNTSAVNGTTLGVTGNMTFGSTGTYAPFVNTSGGSDSVTVTGSGALGGTLNPAGTFTAGDVYTILHGSFTGACSATHGWVATVNASTVTMTHS